MDMQVTSKEQRTRSDLAALYRLVALYGWDDLIFTHISARVPDSDHHFLVNPLGSTFDEITASSLVKVDLNGRIISPSGAQINDAGFTIHSAVHAAREDAKFVIHLHTVDGMAVAAHRNGLLPLNQMSLGVLPDLAYHEYEGIALDLDERERIVASLGTRHTMILKQHGTLAVGPSAGAAWTNIYYLERACSIQVRAMAGGIGEVELPATAAIEKVAAQRGAAGQDHPVYDVVWDAMLRRLRRLSPGFDI